MHVSIGLKWSYWSCTVITLAIMFMVKHNKRECQRKHNNIKYLAIKELVKKESGH